MSSNLNPEYYYSDKIFNEEKERVFKNSWYFVGFTHDLKEENDFVTSTFEDTPVVVQRMRGEIRCFLNVCSHRFSLIQTKEKGNRPLICPYHGWAYSNEGIPVGIPKKPLFEKYSKEKLCEMKLKEFRIEICGSLIFASVKENLESLNEFLGSFYEPLKEMTLSFGHQIDTNIMTIDANWKIIAENTVEAYHLSLVHSETLAKLMPITNMDNLKFDFQPPHSNYIIPLKTRLDSKKLEFVHKPFGKRDWKLDGFQHYLIFPNLLISSSYGTTFNVTVLEPLSSKKTRFISNVFVARLSSGYGREDIKGFVDTAIAYNRKIFLEDKDICEKVQIGVENTDQPGVLSLEELRVQRFQENYLERMENK